MRNYRFAAELLEGILRDVREERDRSVAFSLYNASLYATGQHQRALDAICNEMHSSSRRDQQWIFDVHAHTRRLALTRGFGNGQAMMAGYRTRCRSPVFSPVWVGIPLAKMEYLRRGVHVLNESYVLAAKDRIVLGQLIETHPNDAYIEYAHYFLQQFDRVRRPELVALKRPDGGGGLKNTERLVTPSNLPQLVVEGRLSTQELVRRSALPVRRRIFSSAYAPWSKTCAPRAGSRT